MKQCVNRTRDIVRTAETRVTHDRGATTGLIRTVGSSLLSSATTICSIPGVIGRELVP